MSAVPPVLPRPRPQRQVLQGRYVRLEPLDPARHAPDLFEATQGDAGAERYRYLADAVPADVAAMRSWAAAAATHDDPLMFAVVDAASGRAVGRQSLLRIVPEHGSIEIGHILWSGAMARTRLATEAFHLHARHALDDLGYRRFEWKCNDRNAASKRAALRFGFSFEGVFRQHMWAKGQNRDTTWFSMLDSEWQGGVRAAFERWLAPENFDAAGQQREPLGAAQKKAPR